jgi:phage head maturation protease
VVVGLLSDIFRGERNAILDASAAPPAFAVDAESIPPEVFGMSAYEDPIAYAPKISRRDAEQVGAVMSSHDLIAASLGGLPIVNRDAANAIVANPLFEQPEKNVPRSVTMTRTYADMFYDGIAWWRIIERDYRGFPSKVRRLKPGTVTVDEDQGKVYVNGVETDDSDLIRFDSPRPGLLVAGARAIRTALRLDAAAANYVDGVPPMDFFAPTTDVDPFDDNDEAKEFLEDWNGHRKERSTGYVPFHLGYHTAGWDPEKLQLAAARQHAVLEIARHAGVDPEDLGVSTTSRTYQNDFDRRKQFTDFTTGKFMRALEDRLSMGDVTPRGQTARTDLNEFMRSDPKTRMETYDIGKRVGAWTDDEIRDDERKPRLAPSEKPKPAPLALVPPRPEDADVAADGTPIVTFDDGPALRLDMPADGPSFAVDYERRTISGLLMPYGKVGIANGMRWVFSQGTLKFSDPKRIKMWIGHDKNDVRGYALTFDDRPDGLYGVLKVEDGEAGDEALRKADPDGSATWDAFSVGLRPGGKYRTVGGINYAIEAPLMEVSLTPAPSFEDARVHQVAASATSTGDSTMPLTAEEIARLAALRAMTTRTAEQEAELVALTARETAAQPTFSTDPEAPNFDAIATSVQAGFAAGMAALGNPQGGPERISASAGIEVNEELPYRFDGIGGAHGFIKDINAAFTSHDGEAHRRIDTFMDEAFAVTTGNTATLNPTQNRPELYVPNLQFSTPLWDLVSTGSIDDQTPFTVPKFGSAAGLVADHVQGVEPNPGTFTATNQTITPKPLSGKIEINREVWDQGGNPKADQIIWSEFLNAWNEAREARIATMLAAVGTAEINLGDVSDTALVKKLTAIFTGLQFARGGNRFTAFASDGVLFPKLVDAADSTGRPLLPVLGATNAEGTTSGGFDRVALGNQEIRAAWALGQTPAAKSYLFVPSSVWAWSSAPKRFTFEYQVKSVDMAIWGYAAGAVLRDTDVRPVDYSAADA